MFVFVFIAMFLLSGRPAYASRITIEAGSTTGTVGSGGVSIKAKMLQADSPDSGNSYKENAELKIRNQREGDRCDTIAGGSDVNGYIYGTCYATQTGSYAAYVHSDRGDDSPDVSLTFNDAPAPTTEPDPSQGVKSASAAAQKRAAQGQLPGAAGAAANPLMQDGLAPDQEKVDNGLAPQTDEHATTTIIDPNEVNAGAPDLLKSLIFLTGALVLLIWTGYLIFLQVQLKRKKAE